MLRAESSISAFHSCGFVRLYACAVGSNEEEERQQGVGSDRGDTSGRGGSSCLRKKLKPSAFATVHDLKHSNLHKFSGVSILAISVAINFKSGYCGDLTGVASRPGFLFHFFNSSRGNEDSMVDFDKLPLPSSSCCILAKSFFEFN